MKEFGLPCVGQRFVDSCSSAGRLAPRTPYASCADKPQLGKECARSERIRVTPSVAARATNGRQTDKRHEVLRVERVAPVDTRARYAELRYHTRAGQQRARRA